MAFKNVNEQTKFAKLTDLKVGESLTGYLTGISESSKIPGAFNLNIRSEGEDVSYSVAGNVKYMIKDNKLSVGANTRITREEDVKIKGKTATRFQVEQDLEDMLAGFSAQPQQAASQASTSSVSEKLKSLRG